MSIQATTKQDHGMIDMVIYKEEDQSEPDSEIDKIGSSLHL